MNSNTQKIFHVPVPKWYDRECALCSSKNMRFLLEKNGYKINKCLNCSLVQVTNRPPIEKVDEAYKCESTPKYYKDFKTNKRKMRYVYLNYSNKLDQIEKRANKKGRILDVGCSLGFFLNLAKKRGWEATGVELSEYASNYAKNRFGIHVVNRSVNEAEFKEESFDVITMWYVIEHLPDPKKTLFQLRHFMKDDGMLVVSTSNVESHLVKIQGRKWRIWIPPEHLFYYSPESIRNLYSRCNLEVTDQETALPYERYLRRIKLYNFLNKLELSDNIIFYARKSRHHTKLD